MKIFKKIIVILLLIILTGCGKSELDVLYDKMHVGKDGVNGYSIDLRIYGKVSNEFINKIISVSNYNDQDFKVTVINENMVIYVIDGETYQKEADKYIKVTEKQKYDNPLIYLEGLKNVVTIQDETEEIISENKYKVYNLKVKNILAKSILEEIGIEMKNLNEDIEVKVYVNEKGYLYRIIYYINSLTVNVNYFGINNSAEIVIPQ